jgi:hypothetical protein
MDVTNQTGLRALFSGDYHVGYAALALAILGIVFVIAGPLVLGIVLVVLGVGIFVDTWAHGYFH